MSGEDFGKAHVVGVGEVERGRERKRRVCGDGPVGREVIGGGAVVNYLGHGWC